MKKRLVYKIVVGIILYFVLGIIYKYYKNSTLERTCLTNNFIQNYSDLTYLEINSTHDFDEIFDCEEWNEILVTDAHYYMRGFGYLKNGVLVPAFDQIQYPKGTYLVYFLENNIIISEPVPLFDPNFIFSQNFKSGNYVKIGRKNAKFIYKKFDHTDFDLNTFEIVK